MGTMNFTKSLTIMALMLIASNCIELDYSYTWEDKDCGGKSQLGMYATLVIKFNTSMQHPLPHYRLAPTIRVPCSERDSYKIVFELNGLGGTIKRTDTDQEPKLHNAAAARSAEMSIQETLDYITSSIITMEEPVIEATVYYKIKEAQIILDVISLSLIQTLEEYGVMFRKDQMKTDLQASMQNDEEFQYTKSMEEDILKQLINGQNTIYEKRGNQTVKISVTEKMYVRGEDGILRE